MKEKLDIFYEMMLEDEFIELMGFFVDVWVLNEVFIIFRFKVIGGELLFLKDEKVRCRFEEEIMVEYYDYFYYFEFYGREVFGI